MTEDEHMKRKIVSFYDFRNQKFVDNVNHFRFKVPINDLTWDKDDSVILKCTSDPDKK